MHVCGSATHTDKSKNHCTLPLFHELADPNTQVANGHISRDGHQFECSHYDTYHVIFVIDKSGSMSHTDKTPEDRIGSHKIMQKHNNRLGAVYECVKQFIRTRCGVNGTNQIDNDIMSFVLFDNKPTVVMQNQKFEYNDSLIDDLCRYEAGGSTNYVKAINTTGDLIQRYKRQARWECFSRLGYMVR